MRTVLKGIEYIERHLKDQIRVADIAQYVGYSQFHYAHLFSKATHLSLYDYYMRRRVSLAYEEMVQSEEKILDIAYEFGFASPETFIRAFHRVYGLTPSEVRMLKPGYSLLSQNRIDETYLNEIEKLQIIPNRTILENVFFKGKPADIKSHKCGNYLMMIENQGPWLQDYVLSGSLNTESKQGYFLEKVEMKFELNTLNVHFCLSYVFAHHLESLSRTYKHILIMQQNQWTQVGMA